MRDRPAPRRHLPGRDAIAGGETIDEGDSCVEAVERRRFVWTAAMGPGFRPVAVDVPFTAIITLEAAESGTRYRAVAVHSSPETRTAHEKMGFHEGWGAALDQLVEVARGL